MLVWLSGSVGAAQSHSRRATELETKLFAPCCYIQTLDVHESDLADKLRAEIERRLSAGEAPLSVEDDLVARYGERIRAVPRNSDSRWHIPLVVGAALALGLLALGAFAMRWQRRQDVELQHVTLSAPDAKYDRELDAALRGADDEDHPKLIA